MLEKYQKCLIAGFRKMVFQADPGKDAAGEDGEAFKLPGNTT